VISCILWVLLLCAVAYVLAKQVSIIVLTILYGLIASLLFCYAPVELLCKTSLIVIFAGLLLGAVTPIRRVLLSGVLMRLVGVHMPSMSATEQEALEAGTVSWEGDIFSGAPDFAVLHNAPMLALTEEEQAFLAGPTTELCRMLDDWDITHKRTDLPNEVWKFIKEKGFLGMIIPKQYGGLEFSATAQLSILMKLYGRSISAATTVSVPNSLGPAELLLKYGTEAQKDYYLPRLAKGKEIPCFALTGPNAGSDAASIPDRGVVCSRTIDGKKVLGILLTWNKRYITLCPVATVIGLAFRLFDPDNLLGKGHDVGISCALIPADTKGVVTGRRHFPLNTAFLNGPTQGNDVFVPIDCLIGGKDMAGNGWRMLMECLSAGRAISLPSSACGGSLAVLLATSAYARVRKQFNQAIAKFEGIEEAMARIVGNTYLMYAGVRMTAAAVDAGAKPSVAGAILKYHTTARARYVVVDAMDIHGGKGICLGPNNYLGRAYQGAPISITVEGANILTRSLIIFGQGAIRCHPYVYKEMQSVRAKDVKAFDKAIWGHVGFILANLIRSVVFSVTDGRFTKAPNKQLKRYYQIITRYSSQLALLADVSMLLLGGALKRKEALSARFGDLLSHLYLSSAVLKCFHADGEPADELPLVDWTCQQLFYECDEAIQGIINNYPNRVARILLSIIVRPFGSRRKKPSDKLGQKLAQLFCEPGEVRSRLTKLVFAEPLDNCPLGQVEHAFQLLCQVEPLEKKIRKAVQTGKLHALTLLEQIAEAEKLSVLTKAEAKSMKEAELMRQKVIAVDDFSNEELAR